MIVDAGSRLQASSGASSLCQCSMVRVTPADVPADSIGLTLLSRQPILPERYGFAENRDRRRCKVLLIGRSVSVWRRHRCRVEGVRVRGCALP